MKKFDFRLKSVLKVRGLYKRLAERDLATTKANVVRNEQELENIQDAYHESFNFLNNQSEHSAFWHEVTRRYQTHLQEQQHSLEEQKQKLKEQMAVEKTVLSRRMREERVIEKLKEYQQQEHKLAVDSEDQKRIEEMDILKRGSRK